MTKEEKSQDFKILDEKSIDEDIYDRQKRLNGWDQSKISNATAIVIGAGATGNEVIKNLLLTGIGHLIIIDFDIIVKSNLNRCILFNMEKNIENKYKVDVVEKVAKNLNPKVRITTLKKDLNTIDKEIYKKCDVICSCLDNIEARIQANNYAYYYGIPFVDSGIEGFYGSVQSVYSKIDDTPCLQCGISGGDLDLMWKKFSCTGEEINSEEGETMGKIATIISTTSIIGGLQSQQVIKFILGVDEFKATGKWNSRIGKPLIGRQLNYNGITNGFQMIKKSKNPDCWTCSYKKSDA